MKRKWSRVEKLLFLCPLLVFAYFALFQPLPRRLVETSIGTQPTYETAFRKSLPELWQLIEEHPNAMNYSVSWQCNGQEFSTLYSGEYEHNGDPKGLYVTKAQRVASTIVWEGENFQKEDIGTQVMRAKIIKDFNLHNYCTY